MKKTNFTQCTFCVFPGKFRQIKSVLLLSIFSIMAFQSVSAQCPSFSALDLPGLSCGELGPNVLTNPGFEQGVPAPYPTIDYLGNTNPPGWFMFGGYAGFSNIFVENVEPRSGNNHLKMFGSFNDPFNVNGFVQGHPAVPGETWVGSVWMLTTSGDPVFGTENFAELHVEFYDANGCFVAGDNFKTSQQFNGATPTDQYIQYTAIMEAPPTTAEVRIVGFFFNVNFNGGSIYYDDLSLQKVVTPYTPIVEVTLEPGACAAELEFPAAVAADESGLASFGNDFNGTDDASGSYPIGEHLVTFAAEDNNGLTNSCSFIVKVNEFPNATPNIICNNLINVSLDPTGNGLITPDMGLEGGPYGCYDNYTVTIKDNNNNPIPNPMNCNQIGEVYIFEVTDNTTGNSCWGEVVVEDKLAPVLTCPNRTIPCTANINNAPKPSAKDNCDNNPTEQLISQELIDDDGCDDDQVAYERIWIAIDDYGNESLPCKDTVFVQRPQVINFPADKIVACTQYQSNANSVNPPSSGNITNVSGTWCLYEHSYSDITLPGCGNSFTIIRTWTLLDWCTGQVISVGTNGEDNVQTIKVKDEIAPAFGTNDPYSVAVNVAGAHPQPCVSMGLLQAPNVSDACNDFTVKIFTEIGEATYINGSDGSNGGLIPSPGLPLGDHEITYQATDVCGNTSEFKVIITVVDETAPVVICDQITEVNLSSNGLAEIVANVLDDGSYDNCCMDRFEVARMDDNCGLGTDFAPTTTFCCEDAANSPIMITFRAIDCYGNFNDCMVEVNVNDKIGPVLASCPTPQTITCDFYLENLQIALGDEDYSVLDQFGNPEYQDNCDLDVNLNVNDNVDQCGNGTISRTWTAQDPSGNNAQTCTQIIRVNHVSDWVVEFPQDETAICTDIDLQFPVPVITSESCELIAVSYEDTQFNVVTDACYKIARQWTIINWCVVGDNIDEEVVEVPENQLGLPFPACDLDGDGDCDERTFRDSWNGTDFPGAADAGQDGAPDNDIDQDPWDGYITFEQTIKVIDNVDPVFADGCNVPDVCIEDNSCGAIITLPEPAIQDCSPDVTVTVESDLGSGYGPFIDVAPGTYTVTYSAMDNCGNSNACQTSFIVEDCKKPTPYCKNGLIIELMTVDPAMVEVWATDFDAGSFDNCPGDVQISFSADVSDINKTFNCDHVGQQSIEIWVTDASGNQDYCSTFVFIQANMGQCPMIDDPLVAGLVETEDNDAISGVEININSAMGFDFNQTTQNDGTFSTNVPVNEDYTITPIKDDNPLNGVSTYDLVLITKHILGVNPLNSPYKLIAADVNKSGTITTFDLVTLRKLILFVVDEFPNNTSWRFIPTDFDFANPANPFETSFPEVININNIANNVPNADFVAIKVGDVNNNASLSAGLDDRNATETFVFQTNDISLKAGETYTVDFSAKELAILGYQFTMDFDQEALDFVEILPGQANTENFGLNLLEEGVITSSWHNGDITKINARDILFSLVFTAKLDAQLSDLMNLNSSYTQAEAYNSKGEIVDIELEFNGVSNTNQFELYQNSPNPFNGNTKIAFQLPTPSTATLTISDVNGKVVEVIKGDYSKGYNEINIDQKSLGANGVFYYQLDTQNYSATRKMISIK